MTKEEQIIDIFDNTYIPISALIKVGDYQSIPCEKSLSVLAEFIKDIQNEGLVLRAIRRTVLGKNYEDNKLELVNLTTQEDGTMLIEYYGDADETYH